MARPVCDILSQRFTNLMLHPFIESAAREASLDWFGLVEQEPDAELDNGGLGRLHCEPIGCAHPANANKAATARRH
jgi:hypothetical protein